MNIQLNGFKILRTMRQGALWALLMLAGSVWAQKDLSMEVVGFRVPEYDDQGVMTAQLFGDRAEMQGEGDIKITGLRIEFYKDTQTIATVTSPY
ncbi:MAG: hypothetical protein FJ220_04395, partial [Kiritimatiellaceae bacterium]|nr:hypothetical protein [Kiritimatiellaceae bacterium]